MTDLNTHISDILTAHAGTTYHADCPPSLVTRLALRVRELEVERTLWECRSADLRAAVQSHHDTHYLPVDYCAARPTNAPHDRDLYEAAGVLWMRPEPWDANPAYYRLTAMRAHWERKQVDALTVGTIVGVPEQGV